MKTKQMGLLGKLATAGMVGLAGLLPGEAEAQVSGNVQYIQSERNEGSQIKLNAFYEILKGIKGYTFTELQKGGYFGKTYLDKDISHGIGPRLMAIHGNEPLSETALGINAVVPYTPENVFATVNFLPLWLGNEGEALGDKAFVGYFFSADLPLGLNLSGFGDWDIFAEGGAQWDYGEFSLTKQLGKNAFIGYNSALLNDGDAIPRLEHRVNLGVKF